MIKEVSPQAIERIEEKKRKAEKLAVFNKQLLECLKYLVCPQCGKDCIDKSGFSPTVAKAIFCQSCDLAVIQRPFSIEVVDGDQYRAEEESVSQWADGVREEMRKRNEAKA